MAGIYLHFPFCKKKCAYCDFYSLPDDRWSKSLYTRFIGAILADIDSFPVPDRFEVDSIYIGGGTPSLWPESDLSRIFQLLHRKFRISTGAEITLEANPDSLTTISQLSRWQAAGINRLSIGVQSFQPQQLRRLGRVHSAEQARTALTMARQAGFQALSLDIMYGLPGSDLPDLQADLGEAMTLGVTHLSAYILTLSSESPLGRQLARGELTLPDEDTICAMYHGLVSFLAEHGLEQYEISNFARPGCHSRHNLNYWNRGEYLGFGPAAASFLIPENQPWGMRWSQPDSIAEYQQLVTQRCAQGQYVLETAAVQNIGRNFEILSRNDAILEYIFLRLRMRQGISCQAFQAQFGLAITDLYRPIIEQFVQHGLLEWQADSLRLTSQGNLVSNEILAQFSLLEPD